MPGRDRLVQASDESLEDLDQVLRKRIGDLRRDSESYSETGGIPMMPNPTSRQAASHADEELATQIAEAPAPFWRHVRDALAERHP